MNPETQTLLAEEVKEGSHVDPEHSMCDPSGIPEFQSAIIPVTQGNMGSVYNMDALSSIWIDDEYRKHIQDLNALQR